MVRSNSTRNLMALIKRLQHDNTALQADNAVLQTEVTQLRTDNASLRAENTQLQRENQRLQRQVQRLEIRLQEVTRRLDDAQRKGKRQAAPFSKGPPKKRPKTPGRKPGERYGIKARRQPPPPETIDEIYEALLPETCPACGGRPQTTEVRPQYQTEIPRRPLVRQFNVHIGECSCCRQRLQGRHPLQTSDALGAAAAQLGPDAQAAAAFLNKRLGLSCGKVQAVFKELFGVDVSRGGIVQLVQRLARRCAEPLEDIRQTVRNSSQVVVDETGWRVGGQPAWLHVVATTEATWYAIDPTRQADVLAELLGWDYGGVMVHDGLKSYDRFSEALHQQCASHLLRRVHDLLETARGRAAEFPRQVLRLFRRALRWRDRYEAGDVSSEQLDRAGLRLTEQLRQLASRPRTSLENRRLAAHLQGHVWEWFLFLLLPGTEATNARAEQALRYAVVNRKVWGGNRTWRGAWAQSVLMSVLETCRQQSHSALDFLSHHLRGLPPPLIRQAETVGR